jgi:hypothetical protein
MKPDREYIERLEREVQALLNQMDECECDPSVDHTCYQCRVRAVLDTSPLADPHADIDAAIDKILEDRPYLANMDDEQEGGA